MVDSSRRPLRPVLTALAALLLYAVLIDAAVETYQSHAAVRAWVAVPLAAYMAFTLWALALGRWDRTLSTASLWWSSFLFLGVLALSAMQPDGLTHGMRVAGCSTSTVLSATTIGVIALALASLTLGSPLPLAARIVALVAAGYGVAAFGTGIAWHRSYIQLLQGHSIWERAPYWLQGAFIGTLVVVPFAFAMELGVALARVKVHGRRHRLLAFALGTLIAYTAFTYGQ